jgi:hypothetical protein
MTVNLKAAEDADFRLGHVRLYHIQSNDLSDKSNVIKIETCEKF